MLRPRGKSGYGLRSYPLPKSIAVRSPRFQLSLLGILSSETILRPFIRPISYDNHNLRIPSFLDWCKFEKLTTRRNHSNQNGDAKNRFRLAEMGGIKNQRCKVANPEFLRLAFD